MERENDRETRKESADARERYETPVLRAVELLPDETLGLGCKVDVVSCSQSFNTFGS